MNIFDIVNAALGLYINLFCISFPLTIYFALEINRYMEKKPCIFIELYRKFRAWRERR